jgi:acyl carrier protein
MRTQDIENEMRTFIADNFLFRDDIDQLAGDQSLLAGGLIDSTGALELVAFLESRYGFEIADAEVTPENLDTIDALVAFVASKAALAAA